ncbi:YbaB/EbfC family nucleoid-associated protein [Streptomyces sp. NPDC002547]
MDLGNRMGIQEFLTNTRKLQHDMARTQEELLAATFHGTASGGAVQATVNGKGELKDLIISPVVADPSNAQGLAELIVSAVCDAQRMLATENEARLLPVLDALNTEIRDLRF